MSHAEDLLNRLGEFQSQRDLLDLQKAELLNAVKVPAEIEAAQVAASVKRQAIDREHEAMVREITNAGKMVAAEIEKPELPAEYLEAMSAYNAALDDISSQTYSRLDREGAKVAEAKAKIDADLQSQTAEVFNALERRKAEIATEFGEKAEAVDSNIAKLTAEAKAAVIAEGKSVKGSVYHAVYMSGRITWNTDKLEGMMALIPQLREARKEGQPSVTIRKI